MFMTFSEAARRLAVAHQMGEVRAREALNAGLAGPETQAGRARLFDADSVEALAARPTWVSADLRRAFPEGVLVARLNARRDLHLTDDRADQLVTAGGGWRMGFIPRVVIAAAVQRRGVYPFVGTVSGFPALCANVTGVSAEQDGAGNVRCAFTLGDPGGWHAAMTRLRFALGSGHEVVLLDPAIEDGIYRRTNRMTG